MSIEYEDDLKLAQHVSCGDQDAFNVFYGRYADLVFGYIFNLLNGERMDAEEIWQDTFVSAIRMLASYQGQGRLLSWLCGIARHKVADRRRRRKGPGDTAPTISSMELRELMDTVPLPDEVLNQSALRAHLIEALAELPDDYRIALLARYAEECSVKDIARQLGRSYKATESLLSRAKAALRTILNNRTEDFE
ncbi:RNA polymerase sigma factor [Planctomycetota bacterium]